MSVFQKLLEIRDKKGAGFLLLVDPDENQMDKLPEFIRIADAEGVDAFLVGASLLLSNNFEDTIKIIKSEANKPVIILSLIHI